MKNLNTLVLIIIAGFSALTLLVGTIAWTKLDCELIVASEFASNCSPLTLDQALYASILAIGGSDIYHNHPDLGVQITRWFGAASGLALVLGLLYIFASKNLNKWRISRLTGHLVLVGVNDFSLSYMLGRKRAEDVLVLVDTEDVLSTQVLSGATSDVLTANIDFLDDDSLSHALGRQPAEVVFGSARASVNVQRAQSVMSKRGTIPMRIRSEKQNVTADLDVWSDHFANVPVVSETEFIARALVTELEPLNLARLRGQDRPHIAIIGIGDLALGIIEELGLRCHSQDLGRLKISTFDRDAETAWKKLRMERGGLLEAIEMEPTHALDGTECGSTDISTDPLITASSEHCQLTAIVICTGDDETNVDIGLRIRRLQENHGLCIAPILMRSRSTSTVAPDPVSNLTGGLYRFGGPKVRKSDIEYELMQHRLGRAIHDTWNAAEPDFASDWETLTLDQHRTNTRAALSAVEMYQTLGLVPPKGASAADLRLHPNLIDTVLDLDAELPALAKTEHNRWVAERQAEGWTQTKAEPPKKSDRDDRRKIHWLMTPFSQLEKNAAEEVQKDTNNVLAVFKEARRQYHDNPQGPCWKRRIRIGIMGPLSLDQNLSLEPTLQELRKWLSDNGVRAATHHLEVVSPNAPGYDRVAAAAILRDWTQQDGTADLLFLEADNETFIDGQAAKYVDEKTAKAQSKTLAEAVSGRIRRMRLCGGPISKNAFLEEVSRGAETISDMCDLMIYAARPDGGEITRANAQRRRKNGGALLWCKGFDAEAI